MIWEKINGVWHTKEDETIMRREVVEAFISKVGMVKQHE